MYILFSEIIFIGFYLPGEYSYVALACERLWASELAAPCCCCCCCNCVDTRLAMLVRIVSGCLASQTCFSWFPWFAFFSSYASASWPWFLWVDATLAAMLASVSGCSPITCTSCFSASVYRPRSRLRLSTLRWFIYNVVVELWCITVGDQFLFFSKHWIACVTHYADLCIH